MRIIKAVFRVGRVLRRPLWVTLLSLPLFLESFPALAADADKSNAQPGGSGEEIHELKRQMDEMQKRLDRLSDKDKT